MNNDNDKIFLHLKCVNRTSNCKSNKMILPQYHIYFKYVKQATYLWKSLQPKHKFSSLNQLCFYIQQCSAICAWNTLSTGDHFTYGFVSS